MQLRRILLALLFGLLALGVAPLPAAYAGGPTSVLLVNPNLERTRAAYYSDSVYSALTAALGEGRTGPNAAPAGLSIGGEEVRLTWLIHDMQIWRIDRIHLGGADGVWIETVVEVGGGPMYDAPARWHRPADEAALTAVLSEVGLLGDSGVAPTSPTGSSGTGAEATVPTPAQPVPALVAAGLGGLVLGAAGAFVAMQVQRRTPTERPDRVTLSG
jgi:hypothetical protein